MTACIRVLVATTSQNLKSLICRMLDRCGFESEGVDTADAALNAAGAGEFQAIVTDMHLPDRCGATLIAALRAQGVETPAILLVEEETPRLRELTQRLGSTRCLACPDLDGLKAAISAGVSAAASSAPGSAKS